MARKKVQNQVWSKQRERTFNYFAEIRQKYESDATLRIIYHLGKYHKKAEKKRQAAAEKKKKGKKKGYSRVGSQ